MSNSDWTWFQTPAPRITKSPQTIARERLGKHPPIASPWRVGVRWEVSLQNEGPLGWISPTREDGVGRTVEGASVLQGGYLVFWGDGQGAGSFYYTAAGEGATYTSRWGASLWPWGSCCSWGSQHGSTIRTFLVDATGQWAEDERGKGDQLLGPQKAHCPFWPPVKGSFLLL